MKRLKPKIESLLFIAAKPMSAKQLAGLLGGKEAEIKKAGDELVEEYAANGKGVQIIKNGSRYQMVSSPENAKIVQEFIKDETTGELSRPSLETLTIIAYRGPIAKSELNRIRGVNCSLILRNLLLRGLVEAKNKKGGENAEDSAFEPYYGVTFDFIRYLGISDIRELPDYERLNRNEAIERIFSEESPKENSGPEPKEA